MCFKNLFIDILKIQPVYIEYLTIYKVHDGLLQ